MKVELAEFYKPILQEHARELKTTPHKIAEFIMEMYVDMYVSSPDFQAQIDEIMMNKE